jgi:hypothetical protein
MFGIGRQAIPDVSREKISVTREEVLSPQGPRGLTAHRLVGGDFCLGEKPPLLREGEMNPHTLSSTRNRRAPSSLAFYLCARV